MISDYCSCRENIPNITEESLSRRFDIVILYRMIRGRLYFVERYDKARLNSRPNSVQDRLIHERTLWNEHPDFY